MSIGFSSLFHEKINLCSLGLMGSLIFLTHFFNIHLELDLFFISNFLLFHSHDSSLLNLINNDLCTLFPSMGLSDFSLLFFLEHLKSLDFHHEIKFLLLLDPFRFESLIFLELFVSNCYDLRVEDHLVHLFDVIQIVVHLLLGLREESLVLRCLVFLLISWGYFLSSCFIHLDHFCLLGSRFSQCSSLLLISESLFLENLVFCFNSRCVFNSIKVPLADNYCIVLIILLGFFV